MASESSLGNTLTINHFCSKTEWKQQIKERERERERERKGSKFKVNKTVRSQIGFPGFVDTPILIALVVMIRARGVAAMCMYGAELFGSQ